MSDIQVFGACEHNLKNIDVKIPRASLTVITGVSGSGKSSLAFDTILAEAQRRFFYTLSQYTRQFLDLSARPQVKSVQGLSPAIALAQNETKPSRKSTVGSITDVSELFGVMFSNHGEQFCPIHKLPTTAQTLEQTIQVIESKFKNKFVSFFIPLAQDKKGVFKAQLSKLSKKGFVRAWIDGKTYNLDEGIPELEREEKHVIRILVDTVEISKKSQRLKRSLEAAFLEGQGYVQVCEFKNNIWAMNHIENFSSLNGCTKCGFSWPKLDSRYFNPNSLGKCEGCQGYGTISANDDPNEEPAGDIENLCKLCEGTGLRPTLNEIRIEGLSLFNFVVPSIEKSLENLKSLTQINSPSFLRVKSEIISKLESFQKCGLDYLSLSRRVRSLSGGELQRLKIAGILSEQLHGVIYILDEPSQGLHPSEVGRLVENLRKFVEIGNTIIVVDHDEVVMRSADLIIDLGPDGGADGGRIQAIFKPQDAARFNHISKTAQHLSEPLALKTASKHQTPFSNWIEVHKPNRHNLKMPVAKFPVGALTVVTGVSGAGKTTLCKKVLFENLIRFFTNNEKPLDCQKITGFESIQTVTLIDRSPVAKTSVSIPATYLDLMKDLRQIYAKMPDSQIMGLNEQSFSLMSEKGGRCPECKGRGEIELQMRFLSNARIECPKCLGRRFQPHVLEVKFLGLSMSDVLDLTLSQASEKFSNHKIIVSKLSPAIELGLGYLKMGQPSSSLSGGESQRLKFVPFFQKKNFSKNLLVIEEPTVGLHFEDISKLSKILIRFREQGATNVIFDNSRELLSIADYHIHLGPGAAEKGGQIVYEGVPQFVYLDESFSYLK